MTTLAHGWWLLVLVTLLCLVAAAVALKIRSPIYTATLVVAPSERDLSAASRLAVDLDQYATLVAQRDWSRSRRSSAMSRC